MENKILWVLTLVILFISGMAIYKKAFAGERPEGTNYCQFQVPAGHPENMQCGMDEVMTGFDGRYVYCSRPNVYCYR